MPSNQNINKNFLSRDISLSYFLSYIWSIYARNTISILNCSEKPCLAGPPAIFSSAFCSIHCPIPSKASMLPYYELKCKNVLNSLQ